jgi:pyruvate dehydrogenase E1 component alpha subunit
MNEGGFRGEPAALGPPEEKIGIRKTEHHRPTQSGVGPPAGARDAREICGLEQQTAIQNKGLNPIREALYSGKSPRHLIQILSDEGKLIGALPDLPTEDLLCLYEWMARLRVFDTRMLSLQRQGRIGFFVPSTGEEGIMIGTACALREEDWVFPAYREQGVALYRGYPMTAMICQMMGNRDDFLKGRQMPNHFGSPRYRFAVASSPVGTQIPQAVGCAWASQLQRKPEVAVTYFGDGATSTGDFHAGMTFAAVQQLPVVFFCKNNGWAISLPRSRQTRAECLSDKAIGYGMPGLRVDGNDILAVQQVASEAVDWARSGGGPVFVELVTQRMGPHSTADDPTRYREEELIVPWQKKDPLERYRKFLRGRGLWTDEDEERIRGEADAEITQALKEVESTPQPSLESLFEDVYADQPWHLREQMEELLRVRKSKK